MTLGLAGLVLDASLARTLDDFGHGCRPIAFDWVDAASTTAMFGDQTIGRLALPFSFPFYGESYDTVYITDNGYLTFEAPEFGFPDPVPSPIPSEGTPNAAIYALWQNLVIDDDSAVRFETVGDSPDRALVVEYEQMKVGPRFGDLGGDATPAATGRVDVEVKLWENGTIDVLYGDNPANPGDGRDAAIGIENADGSDALQFSFSDDLLGANVAYRYESVPTGTVSGTVTDANDDLPIGGAVVSADPGDRSVTTAADGSYSIRLRPGTYTLSFSANDYVTHEESRRRRHRRRLSGGRRRPGRSRRRCRAGRAGRIGGLRGLRDHSDHDLEHGVVGPALGAPRARGEPGPAGPAAGAAS